jgi:predicted transcriptional regulator
MKTPCEIILWYILPWVRREIALSLINDHELTQAEVARRLGLTEAAISQYLSGKRGKEIKPTKELKSRIKESAKRLSESKDKVAIIEICKLCQMVRHSDLFPKIYKKHAGGDIPPGVCDIIDVEFKKE